MNKPKGEFKGGNNIALKIPKYQYSETVHFYKEVIKLPYLGNMAGSHAFQFGDVTLWLDCMDNYSKQDVWLELQTDNVKVAADYLRENHINRRDEVEVHENSEGGFQIPVERFLELTHKRKILCRTRLSISTSF